MAETSPPGTGTETIVSEHLEAVISGRLRRAFLLTFLISSGELAGEVFPISHQRRHS